VWLNKFKEIFFSPSGLINKMLRVSIENVITKHSKLRNHYSIKSIYKLQLSNKKAFRSGKDAWRTIEKLDLPLGERKSHTKANNFKRVEQKMAKAFSNKQ
jgi:hypothetical protein